MRSDVGERGVYVADGRWNVGQTGWCRHGTRESTAVSEEVFLARSKVGASFVFESLGELERRIVALKWRAKEAKVEYTPGGMLDLPRIYPPLICILLEEPVLRKNKRMGVSVARKFRSILKDLGSGQYTEGLGRWQGLVLRDDNA